MFSTLHLNQRLIDLLNWMVAHLPGTSALGAMTLLLVIMAFAGPRLATFNRPSWFHRNTLVRLFGEISRWTSLVGMFIVALVSGLAYVAAEQAHVLAVLWNLVREQVVMAGIGAALGAILGMSASWFLIPEWEAEAPPECVDNYIERQSTKKAFDPRTFFGADPNLVFIGKDEYDKPVTIPWAELNSSHVPVIGCTGSGKGVALQTITVQALRKGQILIWFDPKPCFIALRVIAQEAAREGKLMHFIDLRQPVPQLNLLGGLSKDRFISLLIEIFEMQKTGEPKSDHYREIAQKAIRRLAALACDKLDALTFSGLLAMAQASPDVASSENVMTGLEKFASFEQFQTLEGVNLTQAVNEGDIVYVIGDGSSEDTATMQRAVLSRVMQILADRPDESIPVCLVIDEISDLANGTVISLLQKARSRNTHALMAMQSPANLRNARGIDPDIAFSACWGNAPIKLVYRIIESKYVDEIVTYVGEQNKLVKSSSRDPITGGVKETWTQAQVLKIRPHHITNLPIPMKDSGQAAVGFLVGARASKRVHLGPIPIDPNVPAPTISPAKQAGNETKPEEKI